MPGLTIKLFLVNASASSLIIAEVGGWTGKAFVVPRAALAQFLSRPEAQKVGVYILSGPDPNDPFRSLVYVGQSSVVGRRLREHDSDPAKDFFDRAVIFINKDENLTTAHVQYLEAILTARVAAAARTTLMHTNQPGGAALPESDISDMELFFGQIEAVLPVLGLDILRTIATPIADPQLPHAPVPNATGAQEYVLNVGDASARAAEVGGEFVVKAGSIARAAEAPQIPETYRALRKQLKEDGTLAAYNDNTLKFTKDTPFSSPSAAASVVYGASMSGPSNWKTHDGQTYAAVRQATLAAADPSGE